MINIIIIVKTSHLVGQAVGETQGCYRTHQLCGQKIDITVIIFIIVIIIITINLIIIVIITIIIIVIVMF